MARIPGAVEVEEVISPALLYQLHNVFGLGLRL